MKDEVITELVGMRARALVLGAGRAAQGLEIALSVERVHLTDTVDGTQWRRVTAEEDATPIDPQASIRGNIVKGVSEIRLP